MGDSERVKNEESADDGSSHATSKKTLSDVADDKKDSGTGSAADTSSPSPDGQFDENSEKEKAGPM